MWTALKAIPQQEFQKYFQQWQHCWAKCIAAEEEYFGGDSSQKDVSIQECLQWNHSGNFTATPHIL
jgi:hypothetical protein